MVSTELHKNIAQLVSLHGATAVAGAVQSASGGVNPISKVAGAYITSVITGDQAFDENVLNRVSQVLATGSAAVKKIR